jgi:putative heme transporter
MAEEPRPPAAGRPGKASTAPSPARRLITRWLKILAFVFVFYYLVLPQIAGARRAAGELLEVNPAYLGLGLALNIGALVAYAQLTRAALPRHAPPLSTIFRIQLATKAVTNTVPGGTAAGSALGYRLLTLAGVRGADAGFALATAGLGSAVILNVLLWIALVVSIPTRGFNPLYGTAAIVGAVLLGGFAAIVVMLMKGRHRAEQIVRTIARRIRFIDEERMVHGLNHLAARLRDLLSDRQLLWRVVFWAAVNWLLDAASLWVFIRAYGASAPIDGLLVAFFLANVFGAIPITPCGLGIIEGVLIPTLIGFGVPRSAVALGVPTFRLAQFWLPIPLGAVAYASLRFGPWSIDRFRTLPGLREETEVMVETTPSRVEWNERFGRRPRPETDDNGGGDGEQGPAPR